MPQPSAPVISFRRLADGRPAAFVYWPDRPLADVYNPVVLTLVRNIDGTAHWTRRDGCSLGWDTFDVGRDPEFAKAFRSAYARFEAGEHDPFARAIERFNREG